MGGQIGLESALGKGSTFWFSVRLRKSTALQPISDGNQRLVNVRVLVVDDNRTSRQFLHEQIIAWRMRNGKATSGGRCARLPAESGARRRPLSSWPSSTWICRTWTASRLAREIKADPEIAGTRLILLAGFGKRINSEGIADRRICRMVL